MRRVQVFVCDRYGKGKYGQKVKAYGGDVEYTDRDGKVDLLVNDSGTVSIYVNGFTAYDGSVSRLPKILVHEIS